MIEIKIVEWLVYIIVIVLAFNLAEKTLGFYSWYLQRKIKKLKDGNKNAQ